MEKLKHKLQVWIGTSILFFSFYEGANGYYSAGFNINKHYFSGLVIILISWHIFYLVKPVYLKYKERRFLQKECENTYPSTMSPEDLSQPSLFSEFRELLSFFNVFFAFCMYLLAIIILYCGSFTIHKYIVPFANFEKLTLTMTTFVCTDKNSSIQSCSVYLNSPTNGQVILSTSPSIAHEFSNKDKITVEFKHSFIGSSPVRYQ